MSSPNHVTWLYCLQNKSAFVQTYCWRAIYLSPVGPLLSTS